MKPCNLKRYACYGFSGVGVLLFSVVAAAVVVVVNVVVVICCFIEPGIQQLPCRRSLEAPAAL